MARLYTYKITLSNTTSTATPPNLQVRLNINFASLVSNINADLGNIRFSSDQAGNNLLYAWLESAPQGTFTQSSSISSYTNSNVWVNLGNNIIPANGSLNIYMQILSNDTEFDGVYWGANPLWTSTYGQYDNGANVFSLYINGNTPISDFNTYPGITISQVTGITMPNGRIGNALNISGNSGGVNVFQVAYKTSSPLTSGIAESNFQQYKTGTSQGEIVIANSSATATSTNAIDVEMGYAGDYFSQAYMSGGTGSIGLNQQGTGNSNWNYASVQTVAGSNSFYGYIAPQLYSTSGGYAGTVSVNPLSSASSLYIGFGITNTASTYPWVSYINWARLRAYPPNGTDPVLTSIILLVGNYTSASTPVPEWSVLNGKPYVTVSAKGISNGLSNIINDGADFGPDTLFGASLPSQYGPPYTQTSGIQEAINYIASIGGGIIKLNDGIYDVTNAPLQPLGYSQEAHILLPSIPSGGNVINIAIIGNPASRGGSEGGAQPPADYTGGVTIKSLYQNTSGIPYWVIAAPTAAGTSTNLTNVNLFIDGIHIQTSPTGAMGGISLDFIFGVIIGKLYIDIDSSEIFPTTISTGVGIMWGNTVNSSIAYADEISVVGYQTGIYLTSASHMQINKLMADMCVNGLFLLGSPYGAHIGQYDVQNCQVMVGFQNSPSDAWCVIDLISMGDQQTSGYPYDYKYVVQDNGGGGTHYLKANLLAAGSFTPAYSLTANSVVKINHIDLAPVATLPANPPASATVYQNMNPFDIRIYLPAYATTSGTAGSVSIALGSTSTPSTIGTKFINGSTSSSATEIIELVVPAGWYYEFTATGVTFGTATVFPA
ncbi:MAG: hypothetical protein QW203_06985 [Thermoplasmatales archaeon]